MQLNEWIAPVLGIFASRITSEVLRMNTMEKLHKLTTDLEDRVAKRTHELEVSNDELRAFSYSVSHDLRAPVRTICSFVDIVLEDFQGQLPAEAIKHLDRVPRAGGNLNTLIDSMLQLSKITQTGMMLKKINLSNMTTEIINNLQEQDDDRKIEVRITAELTGCADEKLMRIAMENILSNAWKYTRRESKPWIEFGSMNENDRTVFFVRDNGVGFDMSYVDMLFKPFQRLHDNRDFEGTGIGLATVQRVIRRHGGDIWAESEPGKGTTFFFVLGEYITYQH